MLIYIKSLIIKDSTTIIISKNIEQKKSKGMGAMKAIERSRKKNKLRNRGGNNKKIYTTYDIIK